MTSTGARPDGMIQFFLHEVVFVWMIFLYGTGGLHKFAGKPLVAGEEKLEAEMKREFLECCDESVSRIQTTTYGRFKTDLKTEWEFVVNPIEDRVYPGQEGHTGTDPETNKPYQGREIIQLEKFIHHPMAKKAKLNRVEVMGLRFYTGPVVSQLFLPQLNVTHVHVFACTSCTVTTQFAFLGGLSLVSFFSGGLVVGFGGSSWRSTMP